MPIFQYQNNKISTAKSWLIRVIVPHLCTSADNSKYLIHYSRMIAEKLMKRCSHSRVWEYAEIWFDNCTQVSQYTTIKDVNWIRLYLHAKIRSEYIWGNFTRTSTHFHNVNSSTISFCHFWSVLTLVKAVDIAYLRKIYIRPLYCQQVITAYRGTNFLLCCKAIVQWPH